MSLGYQILVLVLYALAVMRLVRLINGDTILDPIRVRLAQRERSALIAAREATLAGQTEIAQGHQRRQLRWHAVNYFVGCPWCVGMWMAGLTTWYPIWLTGLTWWLYPLIALAVSHLVGVMARFADTEEIAVESDDDDQ
ncbi:hypothetical protein KAYACHO_6 [Mycobacterium phage KayaCho]|uniref:hypothetical protein n=1 Tax=Mycobacterium phage KayaCho TaxID=1340830 RepID=UPI0003880D42|nr:hypothetical protein N846_gp06 [Mycobacterium phage KayaCho]AGT12910.1 hypothetical protein KAYACHO_6 [Mycobacterium phage KayaCho]